MAQAPHLIVETGDRLWAVPASAVDAVVELPAVTPLPLVPPHVNGLAALRGAVILVIDLCVWSGDPPLPTSPGQRVVVLLGGDGLRLGVRISRVMGLHAIAGEPADAPECGGRIVSWQSRQVTLLDPGMLDLGELPAPAAPRGAIRNSRITGIAAHVETVLAVRVGGQAMLLPIAMVEEVMPVAALHALPQAAAPVLGAQYIRERVTLVLSLAQLAGLRPGPADILVIATGLDGHVFALAVDDVPGLRQFPAECRIQTPDSGIFAEAFVEDDGTITPLLDRTVLEQSIVPLRQRYEGFLARRACQTAPPPACRIVTFTLEGQIFGLDAQVVCSAMDWSAPLELPIAPAEDDAEPIGCVIHLAEEVLPVYDLRHRLGLAPPRSAPMAWLIVDRQDGRWAVAADTMPALAIIPNSELDPTGSAGLLAAAFRHAGMPGWLLSLDRNFRAAAA